MIARCARCQGTFTTDRFGLQTCPHCGSELFLADPNAPPPAAGPSQGAPPPAGQPPQAPPGATPPSQPPSGASQPPQPPGAAPPWPAPPSAGGLPPARPQPGGWGTAPGGGLGGPPGGLGGPPGGLGGPPGGLGGPPGGGPGLEAPSPFADRRQRGFLASFFLTWKLVATQPHEFFRRVRIDQTGTAVLFGVLATVAGNAFNGLYGYLTRQQVLVALQQVFERVPEEQARFMRMVLGGGFELAQVALSPVFAVIGIYVVAAIVHLLLALFRGARRGFDASLTVVAYAMGLNLLLAVPACGSLIALVWGVVVLIIGLGESHRCGSGRSAAAVLAPLALACLCWCGIIGLSLPAFMKTVEGAASQTQTTRL
jgi:hypothetical protein